MSHNLPPVYVIIIINTDLDTESSHKVSHDLSSVHMYHVIIILMIMILTLANIIEIESVIGFMKYVYIFI